MSKFLDYQITRQSIKDYKSFKDFMRNIIYGDEDSKVGLAREGRAYGYLKRKYPRDLIAISNVIEDQDGIDIVIERDEGPMYFAVSGFADQESHSNCHYKLIVTENKIYQQRTDHPNGSREE